MAEDAQKSIKSKAMRCYCGFFLLSFLNYLEVICKGSDTNIFSPFKRNTVAYN